MTSHTLDIVADPAESFACSSCGKEIDVRGQVAFSSFKCPHCGSIQTVPLKLGSFLLFHLLGRGGMGAVYRALDTSLNRFVAIKVMQKSLGDDPKFVQDFLREARAAAQFNHPHVAQIYSFGEENGQACLVMELVEGGSLDKVVEGGKGWDEVRILQVAVDVAEALKAANKIGLRHGDIKPANILFSKKGEAKVVDFGLAWYAESLQKPGEIWGTPYYIAPEKVESKKADHRADIYSFGATFFHAFTGHAPFEGETARELVVKRLREEAPNLRDVRPDITPATAQVIARTLERDPGKRHPTYTSLLADLQHARAEAMRAKAQTGAGPTGDAPRKRTALWLVLAIVLLAAAIGGVLWLKQQQERTVAKMAKPTRGDAVVRDGQVVLIDPQAPGPGDAEPPGPSQLERSSALLRGLPPKALEPLKDAIRQAAEGDALGASIALQKLQKQLPDEGRGADVVRLTMAMTAWMEGDPQTGEGILRPLFEMADPDHPIPLVSGILLGELAPDRIEERIAGWKVPDQEMARFAMGLRNLEDGRIPEGFKVLASFVETPDESQEWVAAWKPAVGGWQESWAAWEEMQTRLSGWSVNYAKQKLRELSKTSPWFVQREVVEARKNLSSRPKDSAEEDVETAEETPKDDEAQLLRQDEAAIGARLELAMTRAGALDFDGALGELNKPGLDLKTEPGRAQLSRAVEQYQRMADLKRFLVARLDKDPLPQQIPELKGAITGADSDSVQINIRNMATTRKPWNQISAGLYLKLLDYYVKKAEVPDGERADKLLSVAMYCYVNQALERAENYIRMAELLDPGVRKAAADLMPELELDVGE